MKSLQLFLLLAGSIICQVYAAVDNNPLGNGNTLARNTLGHHVEAALHNPALLGVERPPKGGLMLPAFMAGVGVWSDKLALSPFTDYTPKDEKDVSRLVSELFRNSFDLEGLSDEEVSEKLTTELRDGITTYAGARVSLVNFGLNWFACDVTTHFNEEIHLPGGPLLAVFSETEGLQPGNTLDFSTFRQEGIWATDFTISLGLPVTIAPLHELFRLANGAGGISLKYVMGHTALKAVAENGEVTFDNEGNRVEVDTKVKIQTAGLGFSGPWRNSGNIFGDGMPVSGHGFGMDIGGILYDEHGTLSINFNNIGVLFWMKNVQEVTHTIKHDDLTLYRIMKGIDEADDDNDKKLEVFGIAPDDTLKDGNGFTTLLPMALNIGYSYSWDLTDNPLRYRMLADYAHTAINYEQALAKTPGRRLIPRISIGGEAGALHGFMPIRVGYVFGGAEGVASALGAGLNFTYVSLNGSYKAIGSPIFIPRRGVELAAGLTINWGMSSDRDKDSIPDKVDKCRSVPEDRDGFEDADGCPDYDNDADSVPDTLDKCRDIAEDRDQFEDTDGCPDYDNDADGVLDSTDKCPVEPEDKDNYTDEDGCPDPDNDGDNILDASDRCPLHPEDIDGFEDTDGCPEYDNDADGIPDSLDNCMNAPEVFNGYKDDDGCPDTLIKPTEEDTKKLNTKLRAINFKTGSAELVSASYTALDFIAGFLKSYETLRYEIQGHTDNQGSDETNLLLSAARAGTVCTYLLSKGTPEARIIGIGYGETMPIADNKTSKGRADNRRVEFRIIETNDEYSSLKAREAEFKEKVKTAKIKGVK